MTHSGCPIIEEERHLCSRRENGGGRNIEGELGPFKGNSFIMCIYAVHSFTLKQEPPFSWWLSSGISKLYNYRRNEYCVKFCVGAPCIRTGPCCPLFLCMVTDLVSALGAICAQQWCHHYFYKNNTELARAFAAHKVNIQYILFWLWKNILK